MVLYCDPAASGHPSPAAVRGQEGRSAFAPVCAALAVLEDQVQVGEALGPPVIRALGHVLLVTERGLGPSLPGTLPSLLPPPHAAVVLLTPGVRCPFRKPVWKLGNQRRSSAWTWFLSWKEFVLLFGLEFKFRS